MLVEQKARLALSMAERVVHDIVGHQVVGDLGMNLAPAASNPGAIRMASPVGRAENTASQAVACSGLTSSTPQP